MLIYEHKQQLWYIFPEENIRPPDGAKIIAIYRVKEKTIDEIERIVGMY